MSKKFEPFLAHSEITDLIYIIDKDDKYEVTKQCIEAMKATNRMPRWIPVSERLPNQDEYIENNGLFNVSDGNRSYSEWFDVCDTQRFGEPTMYGFRIDHAVIAWMPLPKKPYIPKESEE